MRDFPLIPPTVERALMLYACAYDGWNDGRHVRAAGIEYVTLVDIDQDAITRMEKMSPPSWAFVCSDAITYVIEAYERGARWDLVVCDPWGGGDMEAAHAQIYRMSMLATQMLVIGAPTPTPVPDPFEQVIRNENYCWWVSRES